MNAQFLAQLRLAHFPQRDAEAAPTCADLVTACGEDLQRVEWECHVSEWTAYNVAGSPYSGQTPEDALANLWLATHRQFVQENTEMDETYEAEF